MRKLILTAALFCPLAHASNWELAGTGPLASALVDTNSISHSGKYKKAWVKYSFGEDQEASVFTNYKKWRSSTNLVYFLCDERTSGTVQATYYEEIMSSGKVVAASQFTVQQVHFSEVVPDTLGEAVLEFACGKSQKEVLGLGKKK